MKKVLTLSSLLLAFLTAFSQHAHKEDGMVCHHAKAYAHDDYVFQPDLRSSLFQDYDVKFYFLTIHVENNTVTLDGVTRIDAEVTATVLDTFALELIPELTVDSAIINGEDINGCRMQDT